MGNEVMKTLVSRGNAQIQKRDEAEQKAARDRIRERLFCVCGKNMNAHRLDYVGGHWTLCLRENRCREFKLPADLAAEKAIQQQGVGSAA
jgi:hypothetical protein